MSAQVLNLTKNVEIGTNCGNAQHTTVTYQDVNLNNYKIILRNTTLIITGNLNGQGEIDKCGNQNNSFLCLYGTIQGTPNLNNLSCQTLSNDNFEFIQENYGLEFKVFDISGREISKGVTNANMFENLPKNQVLIVKVEGFKTKKLILK